MGRQLKNIKFSLMQGNGKWVIMERVPGSVHYLFNEIKNCLFYSHAVLWDFRDYFWCVVTIEINQLWSVSPMTMDFLTNLLHGSDTRNHTYVHPSKSQITLNLADSQLEQLIRVAVVGNVLYSAIERFWISSHTRGYKLLSGVGMSCSWRFGHPF